MKKSAMMNNVNNIGRLFVKGAKTQLRQEWIWTFSTITGLYQGLKYKGSVRNGITGGLATLLTFATMGGIYNVVAGYKKNE